MELFGNVPEALEFELIIRAIAFIFAFFGLGLMFSAGLDSEIMRREPRWKKRVLKVAAWASYALAVINITMTISWIVYFFFVT